MTDLQDDLNALRIDRSADERSGGHWIAWILAVLVLGGLGAAGWRWVMRPKPLEVQLGTVTAREAGTRAAVLNATGYVTARRRATVSSKVTGKVVLVP